MEFLANLIAGLAREENAGLMNLKWKGSARRRFG